MRRRYIVQFPPDTRNLDQDEAFFFLTEKGKKRKINFHDYGELYNYPGLYEQLFYDRLKCTSPSKVSTALRYTLDQNNVDTASLRVLDLGAGNGMMGEELKRHGVSRLVGADILTEAKEATQRDRPDVYDAYFDVDFTNLSEDMKSELQSWSFDCLTTVAALGFGDIPPIVFIEALNLLKDDSWIAFNIKENFIDRMDESGFSKLIRELIFSKYLDIHHMERYNHRYSIDGEPLYYFAIVCKKHYDVPDGFLSKHGIK